MTPVPGPHLSLDDVDAWLAGALGAAELEHLEQCTACHDRVFAEREIVGQLATLPRWSPAPGFADRVMQAVTIPDPFALRALRETPRRLLRSRRTAGMAAGLGVLLLGSMAWSIGWTLAHPDALASIGSWLVSEAAQAAWLGLRGVASNLIEQPWYGAARDLLDHPWRLALASALATLAYAGGVLALRRLLTVPTTQVAHASA